MAAAVLESAAALCLKAAGWPAAAEASELRWKAVVAWRERWPERCWAVELGAESGDAWHRRGLQACRDDWRGWADR